MSTTSFNLKDSSLTLQIGNDTILPGHDFKIISFRVSEYIFTIPTFSMQYSTPVNTEKMDLPDITISLEISTFDGGKFKVNYTATVLTMQPNIAGGVLIPKDSFYQRRSQAFGDKSLDSIIQGLNLTSGETKYTLESGIQSDSFYQLNETNWQCGSRLLNLTGKDYLWAVTEDKVKLFSSEITNPKEVSLGRFDGFTLNASKLVKNLPDSIDSNPNMYYGTLNCAVPSISKYPKESALSMLAKNKYTDWRNVTVHKTVPQKVPDLSIGDSVKFDWESDNFTDFLLIGQSYTIGQGNNKFEYTFANYSGWNPAEV